MYISPINQMKRLMAVCLCSCLVFAACTDSQRPDAETEVIPGAEDPGLGVQSDEAIAELVFKPISHRGFGLSGEIPEGWTQVTKKTESGLPVVNILPDDKTSGLSFPLSIQSNTSLTHIDVYPQGHDSGFPIGKSHRLRVFDGTVPSKQLWDPKKSRIYVLGNGEVWAYLLYPDSPPATWNDEGFIFAQIAIENFSSECFDDITGQRKDMQQCQPMKGDEVLYYGRVNVDDQRFVHHSLAALSLD